MARESLRLRQELGGSALRPEPGTPGEYNSALRADSAYLPSDLRLRQTLLLVEDIDYVSARVSFDPADIPVDGEFGPWEEAVLVKNTYGIPATSLDGIEIRRVRADNLGQYNDGWVATVDSPLRGGYWYYYALYAKYNDSGNVYWTKVGEASWLQVKNYGYPSRVWRMFPEHYRRLDSTRPVTGTLRRFCDVIGFELNYYRTWVESLGDLRDFSKMSAKLLPEAGHALGQPLEQAAGDKRMRVLLTNLLYLRKRKGTKEGIEGYLTALTGYQTRAYRGLNLMPTSNETRAEFNTGAWTGATNATFERQTFAGTGYQPNGPYFRNVATGSSNLQVSTSSIPVEEGHEYQFGINLSSSATTAWSLVTGWRTATGAVIGSDTVHSIGSRNPTWSRASTPWVEAPEGAVRMYVAARANANQTTGAIGAFWRAQVADRAWRPEGIPGEQNNEPFSDVGADTSHFTHPEFFEEARMVHVNMYPRRVNLAINSDFALNGNSPGSPVATAWTVEDPATYDLMSTAYDDYDDVETVEDSYTDLAQGLDPLASTATLTYDTGDRTLTLSVSDDPYQATLRSDLFPVMEAGAMSAAIMAESSTAGVQLTATVEWYSDNDTSSGMVVDGVQLSSESSLLVLQENVPERIEVASAYPPPGASYGRFSISTHHASSGYDVVFSKALIETAAVPGPYFDGTFTEGDFGDFFFADNQPAHQAASVYYPAYRSFLYNPGGADRVSAVMADIIPLGRPFKLVSASNGLFRQ